MMNILDYAFDGLHILIICLNLFAWIPSNTRWLHVMTTHLTAASWLILGYWYGWGYCVLTDWHWSIKGSLGQETLPNNYIAYLLERYLAWHVDKQTLEMIIVFVFSFCLIRSWLFCWSVYQASKTNKNSSHD